MTAAAGAQLVLGSAGVYYPWIIAAHQGEPNFVDVAVNGAKSQDQIDLIYAHSVVAGDELFCLLGTNDRVAYGGSSGAQELFQNSMSAAAYWLAGGKKLPSADWTLTGTGWGNSSQFGTAFCRASGVSGDYAEATFNGDVCLFGYALVDGFNGTFTLAVDGASQGTFSCLSPTTIGGTGYGPGLMRIAGFGPGSHTLRATVVSNGLGLNWLGSGVPAGSSVYLLTQPRTSNTADDSNVAIYNGILAGIASQATADGYSVTLIDTGSTIDPTIDLADAAHPNGRGQAKMAAEVLSIIP